MNWLVSGLPDHLRRLLSETDQKRLGTTICAHLVAAGVLKPLSEKASSKAVNFTVSLIIYHQVVRYRCSNSFVITSARPDVRVVAPGATAPSYIEPW